VTRARESRINSGFGRYLHKLCGGINRRFASSVPHFRKRLHRSRCTPLWTACKLLIMRCLQMPYFD